MARIGLLFPGQGAQHVGMGRELAQKFQQAADVFSTASEVLGYDVSSLCFDGPEELLNQTRYTQPAILTVSVAAYRVLASLGIEPLVMAGLSLGEYSALVAAGALNIRDGLKLVAERARLMEQAVKPGEGAMAAVNGLETDVVEMVCAQNGVEVANYNCPGQLVIAGMKAGVEAAGKELSRLGARVIPLAVSVPSHCRLMQTAAVRFAACLKEVELSEPAIPVVSNVTAREHAALSLKNDLVRQLYSPVRWEQSIRYMAPMVDGFIEVGPGSVLTSLLRRIERSKAWGSVSDLASLDQVMRRF